MQRMNSKFFSVTFHQNIKVVQADIHGRKEAFIWWNMKIKLSQKQSHLLNRIIQQI